MIKEHKFETVENLICWLKIHEYNMDGIRVIRFIDSKGNELTNINYNGFFEECEVSIRKCGLWNIKIKSQFSFGYALFVILEY